MVSQRVCIYCGATDQTKFTGVEHVIPQGFGLFGSQTPTLGCVCDDCNQFFGEKLDRILTRDTLEGITRYKQGLFSKETRSQKDMSFTLEEGEETGEFGGMLIRGIDGKTSTLLKPPAQLQVFNKETKLFDIFTKDQIAGLTLPDGIYGKGGERQYKIFAASQAEHDEVIDELRKAGIPYTQRSSFQPHFLKNKKDTDKLELPIQIKGTVDKVRKRALCKILFNFVAFYLGEGEVLKSEWDGARQFIRFDGKTLKGCITNEPFWDGQESRSLRYTGDSYNLRVENRGDDVVGVIQFYNLFTYEVILVEGYQLTDDQEIAYRFTPGQAPQMGVKMSRPNLSS